MSVKALQDYTFKAKYAAYLPDKKRRENWNESVNRSKNMMLKKYAAFPEVERYVDQAYSAVKRKEVLGSQRALQFAGEAMFKHNARGYNCCSSYVDRARFFQECMYLLLCGAGCGFSVQNHHVNKLPKLTKEKQGKKTYRIPDSIEGWSDAIGILVCSYFEPCGVFDEFSGYEVRFDYTLIRQKGAPISSCSGKAPGPEPLKIAIGKIRELLDKAVEAGQTKLRPIQAYDIVMHLANAVISGGVRRSATICIFSPEDEEMMNAKTGDWFYSNPQRGRSNNSCLLLRNQLTFDEFNKFIPAIKEFGEPGFVFADSPELVLNPCVEIGFWCYDIVDKVKYQTYVEHYGYHKAITENPEDIGLKSGWQCCNLSTQNCAKIKTVKDFFHAAKNAAIIGTLQAGFDDFPYLGETTNNIVRREALLGVSMTGILDAPDVCLNPEVQKRAARIARKTNKKVAKIININPAARVTCVKPEGSTSCVLGTASGIHPHHSHRYIRRVQANKTENIYQFYKKYNPLSCEKSVWSSNDTDDVISFCIELSPRSKTKHDISGLDLLDLVKLTQENWVLEGRNIEYCTQPWLSHNVSNTIHVKPNEWDDIVKKIFDNREYYCGISLIPESGDKDYNQAPFVHIYTPEEIVKKYGEAAIFASGLIEEAKNLFEDDLWKACDAAAGIIQVHGKAKQNWVERVRRYADRYCKGNLKELLYCLKSVDLYKTWCDLNREYLEVNYDKCFEDNNQVEFTATSSCSGGKCEIF